MLTVPPFLPPALRCVCHLCTNHTCETEPAGACWNSVTLVNGKEERVKSCLTPAQYSGQMFCQGSRNLSKRHCCFTDFCNNVTLHLYSGTARSGDRACGDGGGGGGGGGCFDSRLEL